MVADPDLSPVPADYRGGIENDGLHTEYLINRLCDMYTPSLPCIGEYRTIGNTPWDLVLSLPGCVCPKVKDMGPFWASRE